MKAIRDNKLLFSVLAAVLLVAGYEWGVSPFLNYASKLQAKVTAAEHAVAELAALENRYRTLAREIESQGLRSNPVGFNLLSYLQQAFERLEVKTYVKSMRPAQKDIDENHREELVGVEVAKIPLKQFVELVSFLETELETVWIVQATCRPDAVEGMHLEMTVASIVDKDARKIAPKASGRRP